MRFAKKLKAAAQSFRQFDSVFAFGDTLVNYKGLKNVIKDFAALSVPANEASSDTNFSNESISNMYEQVTNNFVKMLTAELHGMNFFYERVTTSLIANVSTLKSEKSLLVVAKSATSTSLSPSLLYLPRDSSASSTTAIILARGNLEASESPSHSLLVPQPKTSQEASKRLSSVCLNLGLLRKWVLLNCLGVMKIVKKHDKNSRNPVKQYVVPLLRVQPFYNSQSMVELYSDVVALCRPSFDSAGSTSPDYTITSRNVSSTSASQPPSANPGLPCLSSSSTGRGEKASPCPLCGEPLVFPVMLSCQHRFCWNCAKAATTNSSSDDRDDSNGMLYVCPTCKLVQEFDPSSSVIEGDDNNLSLLSLQFRSIVPDSEGSNNSGKCEINSNVLNGTRYPTIHQTRSGHFPAPDTGVLPPPVLARTRQSENNADTYPHSASRPLPYTERAVSMPVSLLLPAPIFSSEVAVPGGGLRAASGAPTTAQPSFSSYLATSEGAPAAKRQKVHDSRLKQMLLVQQQYMLQYQELVLEEQRHAKERQEQQFLQQPQQLREVQHQNLHVSKNSVPIGVQHSTFVQPPAVQHFSLNQPGENFMQIPSRTRSLQEPPSDQQHEPYLSPTFAPITFFRYLKQQQKQQLYQLQQPQTQREPRQQSFDASSSVQKRGTKLSSAHIKSIKQLMNTDANEEQQKQMMFVAKLQQEQAVRQAQLEEKRVKHQQDQEQLQQRRCQRQEEDAFLDLPLPSQTDAANIYERRNPHSNMSPSVLVMDTKSDGSSFPHPPQSPPPGLLAEASEGLHDVDAMSLPFPNLAGTQGWLPEWAAEGVGTSPLQFDDLARSDDLFAFLQDDDNLFTNSKTPGNYFESNLFTSPHWKPSSHGDGEFLSGSLSSPPSFRSGNVDTKSNLKVSFTPL